MRLLTPQQQKHLIYQYIGAKPKYHKGKSNPIFGYHTCGNCGATIEVIHDYCFKCGYRVIWDSIKCLTGQEENKQIELTDFIEV